VRKCLSLCIIGSDSHAGHATCSELHLHILLAMVELTLVAMDVHGEGRSDVGSFARRNFVSLGHYVSNLCPEGDHLLGKDYRIFGSAHGVLKRTRFLGVFGSDSILMSRVLSDDDGSGSLQYPH
jgi:hypothetical protein